MANNIWSSTGNTDYNTASNWSLGNVPAGTDVAYFDSTSVVNCTVSANITPPSINMVVAYTGTLTLGTYDITCSANFVVAGKCIIGSSSNTGLVCSSFSVLNGGRMSSNATAGNPSIITISGTYNQTSSNSSFLAGYTRFTMLNSFSWSGNVNLSATMYNNMDLIVQGSSTITLTNIVSPNGFNSLTCASPTKTTTIASTFGVQNLVVGSGVLTGTGTIYLQGQTPLTINPSATISISALRTYYNSATKQVIQGFDYGCQFVVAGTSNPIQAGNITCTGFQILGDSTGSNTSWKTDGYNLTVAGDLIIGRGLDSGLKKLDSTSNGGRYSTITVGGNWLNYGTGSAPSQFLSDISTVIFNASTGTQTLTNGSSINPNSLFNLIHSGAGTLQLQDHCWVNAQWLNSAGTFDPNGKTLSNNYRGIFD